MVGWLEGITLSFFSTEKEQLLSGNLQSAYVGYKIEMKATDAYPPEMASMRLILL